MKANKLHVKEIISKGEATISSFSKSLNAISFLVSSLLLFLQVTITETLLGVLISALAIFTGFFFTLIVYITDKSVSKIAQINDDQKNTTPSLAARTFKQAYIDFTKKIISQISYSIILSIFLIIVAFITQVHLFSFVLQIKSIKISIDLTCIISFISTFIFCYLTIRLLYFILVIISNMQSFFYSEIDQVQDRYK